MDRTHRTLKSVAGWMARLGGLSLVFSAIALTVSLVTVYYNFFYINRSAWMLPVSTDVEPPFTHAPVDKYDVTFRFLAANSGNRFIVLSDVVPLYSVHTVGERDLEWVPILIEPGQAKPVVIHSRVDIALLSSRTPPAGGQYGMRRFVPVTFRLSVMDERGYGHLVDIDNTFSLTINERKLFYSGGNMDAKRFMLRIP